MADSSASQGGSHGPHELERDLLYRKRKKKGKFTVMVPPAPVSAGPLVDTHAHFGAIDAPLALARAAFWGLDFICCITEPDNDAPRVYAQLDEWRERAADLLPSLIEASEAVLDARDDDRSAQVSALLQERKTADLAIPHVRLAIGCHPHTSRRWNDHIEALMYQALADPRTCAVGEVGLDYFYDLSPRRTQKNVFRRQVRLAKECGVPVFLHIRDGEDGSDAHADALAILNEEGVPEAGVILHCCSLPPERLQPWVDAGAFIAYGGIVTFTKQDEARAGVALVPDNRLLFETDSPYMAPHPLRGNQCAPDFVRWTAGQVAEVRGCSAPADERALFAQVHANALGLQDRPATRWQRQHAALAGPLQPVYAEHDEDDENISDEEILGDAASAPSDAAGR
jgi:TatD DNase family protein